MENNIFDIREKRLIYFLQKIKKALNLSEKQFLDYLQVSEDEYNKLLSNSSQFPVDKLLGFAEKVGVDLKSIVSESVDIEILAKRFSGDKSSISSKLLDNDNSNRVHLKSIKTILDFLSMISASKHESMLKKYQLCESSLGLDVNVKWNFLDELYKDIGQALGPNEVIEIGKLSFLRAIEKIEVPHIDRDSFSKKDILLYVVNGILKKYDHLWSNQIIKLTENICILRSKIVESNNKYDNFGSKQICHHKIGFALGALDYFSFTYDRWEILRCVHDGDESCDVALHF